MPGTAWLRLCICREITLSYLISSYLTSNFRPVQPARRHSVGSIDVHSCVIQSSIPGPLLSTPIFGFVWRRYFAVTRPMLVTITGAASGTAGPTYPHGSTIVLTAQLTALTNSACHSHNFPPMQDEEGCALLLWCLFSCEPLLRLHSTIIMMLIVLARPCHSSTKRSEYGHCVQMQM